MTTIGKTNAYITRQLCCVGCCHNSGPVFVGDKSNVIRDVRKSFVNKTILFYLSTHVFSQMSSMFSFTIWQYFSGQEDLKFL